MAMAMAAAAAAPVAAHVPSAEASVLPHFAAPAEPSAFSGPAPEPASSAYSGQVLPPMFAAEARSPPHHRDELDEPDAKRAKLSDAGGSLTGHC